MRVDLYLRDTHIVAVQQGMRAACLPNKRPKEMYNRTGIIESLRYPDSNYVPCSWYIHVEDASQVSNWKCPWIYHALMLHNWDK